MKVAFINPCSENTEIMHKCPPYGILSLIAYLNKELGDEVDTAYFDDFLEKDIKKTIDDYSPDLIGISSTTATIKRAYHLSDHFRKENKRTVVLGGKHVSALPEEAINHADYVVAGEGERGLTELVENLKAGKDLQDKIIYSKELKDLDSIPPIPWDILDVSYYLQGADTIGSTVGFDKVGKSIGLVTSRGCPFRCIFCHNSKRTTKVRYHSPQRVADEIEFMLNKWGMDSIFFFDDEFLSNKKRVSQICHLIKERGLKFQWACQARAEIVNDEILDLIKEAGCVQIGYGFESGSTKMITFLKDRNVSIAKNTKAVHLTKKHGIKAYGNIILGAPTETVLDFFKSLFFVMINPIDVVATSVATAYPGTKLWDYCIENKIFSADEIDYNQLSILKHTYYLNDMYIPRKRFNFLMLIYRAIVFVFKRGYSFKEIQRKVINKITQRSLDAK